MDINSFDEDLKAKLNLYGVPSERVKVTAVETTEVSVENSFDWKVYDHMTTNWAYTTDQSSWSPTNPNRVEPPEGSSGGPYKHIWVYNQGQKIVFYGYEQNAYRDFMYMPNDSATKKTFTFTMDDANINNHSMKGGGFLFNVNITGDTYASAASPGNLGSTVDSTVLSNQRISGYMLLLEKQGSGASKPALYKIDNMTLANFHNNGASLTSVPLETTGSPMAGVHEIKIEVSGNSFKMWDTVGGVTNVSQYDGIEDFGSYGFGPIAQYTSHACTLLSWFNFENLQMETTKTKKFMEVLREPVWSYGSSKYVINLDDSSSGDPNSPIADFSDPEKLGEILSRMSSESMHYVGWGLDDNADPAVDNTAEQAHSFIQKNENRGVFVNRDGSTYDQQLEAIAQYIVGEYNKTLQTDASKIPAGSNHQLKSSPESAGTNADGKWKISYEPAPTVTDATYFPYHDIPLDELNVKLSTPGTYKVYHDDKLLKTVEVYSQPVSHFSVSLTPNGGQYDVTLTNESYDPYDAHRDVVTGAVEQWRYKETTASDWTIGKPTSLDANKDYVIELRMQDEAGEWTKPYVKYVSTKAAAPAPIADFTLLTNELNLAKQTKVNIKDLSYDPTGANLANTTITVTKSGQTVAVPYNNGELDFGGLGTGKYKISIVAENAGGTQSVEPFTRVLTVIDDSIAPAVTVSKSDGGVIAPDVISLTFSDPGNSGLAYQQYAITTNTTTPSAAQWSGASAKSVRNVELKELGDYYIHYRAVDLAGNEQIGYFGPYQSYKGDTTKSGPAKQNLNLGVTDFVYSYPEAYGTIKDVIITQLPANGKLKLNGTELSVTDSVYRDDLDLLVFEPDENWHGITSIKWQGTDGSNLSAEQELVLIVNTAPVSVNGTKRGAPGATISFGLTDFKINDVDQDNVTKIKITSLPSHGALKLNGADITINQEISAGDIPSITYEPLQGWTGTVTFNWSGFDGIAYSGTDAVMTISVAIPYSSGPVTEQITIDVDAGNGGLVSQATIKRTTDAEGKVTDQVNFSAENAAEAVSKLAEQGATTARIVIPDTGDRVSETEVIVPKAALDVLTGGDTSLEIYTANGRIVVPAGSLGSLGEDLYFRIVPIKSESEKEEVIRRVKQEEMVRQFVQDDTVQILGRPLIIETNMKSQPVIITLPLYDRLPDDPEERTHILDNLVIFIEHDDGTKDLAKPELTNYATADDLGVQFGIDKFSIFTMVYMEGWEAYFASLLEAANTGEHQAFVAGYPDGTFQPNRQMTRAEVAALLARTLVASTEAGQAHAFGDLTISHWAYESIQKAVESGLMRGYPDGNFYPDRIITRAEMATIIYQWKGFADSQPSPFADTEKHWAEGMIGAVQAAGLLHGYADSTYKPNQGLTRAEGVHLFNRLLERGPLKGVAEAVWPDVAITHWAFEDVAEASQDHRYTKKDNEEYLAEEDQ